MAVPGPGMPALGAHGGRMRNTFANLLSKNQTNYQNPGGAQALPALDPASTANYYSQLGGLYAQYQTQLLGLKQQRVGARADFRTAAAGIQAQKVQDLATAENSATERGILGGSSDLQARAGVVGGAEAARQAALAQRRETVMGTRIAAQQAGVQYYQGSQQLQAQQLAQQQQLLAQQLQNNLIVSGQETQMDALKAMYEALAQQYGGGQGGARGATPTRPTIPLGFYNSSGGGYATQTSSGKPLY